MTQKLNTESLVALLSTVNNATPATITYSSIVAMNKFIKTEEGKELNPYYNRVVKEQISNVFLGVNYTNAVNKRRDQSEPVFVAKQNMMGVKEEDSILIKAKDGSFTVMTYFLTNSKPKVKYFVDGVEIDKSELVPYFKPYSATSTATNPVIVRAFKLQNIKTIKIHGNEYINTDLVTESSMFTTVNEFRNYYNL